MNDVKQYTLLDLFPNCCLPSCEQFKAGIVHQHIWPKQQEILDCNTKYLYCQGGVGSAKTVAFAAKCVHLSLSIPENRGVVSRLNYDDLFDSSWREIKACFRRLHDRGFIGDPEPWYSKKVQGDHTQINLPNGSEIKAIQGKNWSRGLGASHGWWWIDDGMEAMEEFFVGNETSAGLLSRLRLPHVHYRQGIYDEVNRPHGSLHGMVSTNPPPVNHWLHKLFGKSPGMHKIGEDSVEWIQTATSDNPAVGADYAKGLMAVQSKMGHSQNVARRVIFGESIPAYGGVKVFPEFSHERHVAPLKYKCNLPLVRGWDFGFLHPAVTFSNLYRCDKHCNHYLALSEVSECFNINIWDLYKIVNDHTKLLYKDSTLVLDGGDRSGYRHSSSNRDNRSDMRILMQDYKLPFKWRYLNVDSSLEYMRKLLKTQCQCGLEMILVSPNCPVLIGALEGGYKYPKPRNGPVGSKPYEDRYFADVACAWRYGAENFVRFGVPFDMRSTEPPQPAMVSSFGNKEPWAWMNMTDAEMGKLLTN